MPHPVFMALSMPSCLLYNLNYVHHLSKFVFQWFLSTCTTMTPAHPVHCKCHPQCCKQCQKIDGRSQYSMTLHYTFQLPTKQTEGYVIPEENECLCNSVAIVPPSLQHINACSSHVPQNNHRPSVFTTEGCLHWTSCCGHASQTKKDKETEASKEEGALP